MCGERAEPDKHGRLHRANPPGPRRSAPSPECPAKQPIAEVVNRHYPRRHQPGGVVLPDELGGLQGKVPDRHPVQAGALVHEEARPDDLDQSGEGDHRGRVCRHQAAEPSPGQGRIGGQRERQDHGQQGEADGHDVEFHPHQEAAEDPPPGDLRQITPAGQYQHRPEGSKQHHPHRRSDPERTGSWSQQNGGGDGPPFRPALIRPVDVPGSIISHCGIRPSVASAAADTYP